MSKRKKREETLYELIWKSLQNMVVPPYPWFCFLQFVTLSQCGPEADGPPEELTSGQWSPNATSQCLRHSPHFLSSHR